jgi:chromosomal replication initiation ATPase DnaA
VSIPGCYAVARPIAPPAPLAPLPPRAFCVLADVAERHDVSVHELRGPSRRLPLAHVRQEAMWLLRQLPHAPSHPTIGRWLGGRHHTTIIHGVRSHERRAGGAC